MSQTIYPDTEVAYWVIPADDAFSVEVVTQWNHPKTVTPFATAADAKAWIAEHRRRVQLESEPSHWFCSSGHHCRATSPRSPSAADPVSA
jgi:hypothetical protein